MQWNRLVVNLWSKMSLFCSMKEGVSYLFLSAITYLLFYHVQPPPRSAVPHMCCRPSNGRKMQALTAVEWLTAVRYETDGRLANGWTDGLPENRLTGLGAGLPLTLFDLNSFRREEREKLRTCCFKVIPVLTSKKTQGVWVGNENSRSHSSLELFEGGR